MTGTTTDKPICGFILFDLTLCHELREKDWCEKHQSSAYSVCKSCGGNANHECPFDFSGEPCRTTLCVNCVHHLDDTHGAVMGPAFAPPPPPPRQMPPQLIEIRRELIAVMEGSLMGLAKDGKLAFTGTARSAEMAERLFDDLATHAALRSLIAMAGVPNA